MIQKSCEVKVNNSLVNRISADTQIVGSIDQGTSSSRFLVFTPKGEILASAQVEHTQIFPPGEDTVGWHEHDPMEIWQRVKECISAVSTALNLEQKSFQYAAIGITNQRETTIAWNAKTGKPYYNAIVWDDTRTTSIASNIANGNVDVVREQTGLPMASYFAGTKVRWLLDNVPQLKADLSENSSEREFVRFGTIDTWLVYQLTGSSQSGYAGNVGGLFITDVTNASRWLFMNIRSCQWDQGLIDTLCGSDHANFPYQTCLPKILPSSHIYGNCSSDSGIPSLVDIPIASILGDQQAALFGQTAFTSGQAKCTYGTGLFLMMNTAQTLVPSTSGLLTTVAYQLSPETPPVYALEGSVSHSGSVIQWLRDQLGIIQNAPESEILANQVATNDGLYFVPAFAGLFAPYWRSDARGCIVGMTASHTKHHICRAALEATAYQCRELLDAISIDSGVTLKELKVDGGATANQLLMQFQSDMLNTKVICPKVMETTAMGAAFAAGLAVGVWNSLEEIQELWGVGQIWEPQMEEDKRIFFMKGWKKAITKSFGWVEEE